MEDKSSDVKTPEENPSLENQLTPLLTELYYPSESDEPVTFISCPITEDGPLTEAQLREWLQLPAEKPIEEKSEDDFWTPVIEEKDWYGDEEKARTEKFKQLKTVIDQHLTDRQVFRVGETEIDLYLLGRQPDGKRSGLKTMVVET